MSGGTKKNKKKKNPNGQGKEISRSDEEEEKLTEPAAMATRATPTPQASLESISKQIQAMQKELKIDLKTVKDEITTQVKSELAEFKEDINQKLVKINAVVEEQNDKIDAALTRTEEVEQWSTDAKCALKDILKEQKIMMDKMDDLESRSRRNNLRIYGIPEDAELRSESVAAFMDKWLKDELSIESDLQIQRAHRALAPKPKTGQPPRSIILNFQQFNVKEKVLKEAWGKKTVKLGESRIYFDHDYSVRMLQERKAYVNVKKVLKGEGIRFQTPLNRMRIHWASGMKTYSSAEEAVGDMRRRGYEVDDIPDTGPD